MFQSELVTPLFAVARVGKCTATAQDSITTMTLAGKDKAHVHYVSCLTAAHAALSISESETERGREHTRERERERDRDREREREMCRLGSDPESHPVWCKTRHSSHSTLKSEMRPKQQTDVGWMCAQISFTLRFSILG